MMFGGFGGEEQGICRRQCGSLSQPVSVSSYDTDSSYLFYNLCLSVSLSLVLSC